ncbi:MAG: YceD family protein [Azoarcus sp.]|nr:YceD family protein [Azoarcus sp.]
MTRIVDVFRFAAEGRVLEGETPVAVFERLADQLADSGGAVRWRLAGSLDAEGEPGLDLEVSGRLVLCCQRCLGKLEHDLAITTALRLVRSGQALSGDELENDEIEVDGEVDALLLIEDEIILALPIAPRHEDCGVLRRAENGGATPRKNPICGWRGGGG